MTFPFSLDKSTPTRLFQCPECKRKSLKRYWDNDQNEYFFDTNVGRCNHQDSCGYNLSPSQYYKANGLKHEPSDYQNTTPPPPKKLTTYIDSSLVEKAKIRPLPNYFIDYLNYIFQEDLTNSLLEKFKICPSNHWKGSTIFWQIDEQMRVRTGKVMLYDAKSGKRVKLPFNHIHWVHSLAKIKDFQLEQCFFGLHQLIKESDNIIGIVESEKTAILMTAIYPNITWLASGGMGLSIPKFEPLEGRKIILFPDVGLGKGGRGTPYEIWSDIADTLNLIGFDITISSLIENAANEEQRIKGYDLADYLIKTDSSGLALAEGGYPLFWDIKTNNLKN